MIGHEQPVIGCRPIHWRCPGDDSRGTPAAPNQPAPGDNPVCRSTVDVANSGNPRTPILTSDIGTAAVRLRAATSSYVDACSKPPVAMHRVFAFERFSPRTFPTSELDLLRPAVQHNHVRHFAANDCQAQAAGALLRSSVQPHRETQAGTESGTSCREHWRGAECLESHAAVRPGRARIRAQRRTRRQCHTVSPRNDALRGLARMRVRG